MRKWERRHKRATRPRHSENINNQIRTGIERYSRGGVDTEMPQ